MRSLGAPRQRSLIAACGLRFFEYLWHDESGPHLAALPVSDLQITLAGSSHTPTYHGGTGVHGFVRLSPGTHRVFVRDRQGRFLPRAVEVSVAAELHQWQARLDAGADQALPQNYQPVKDVALYRAPGSPRIKGQTAIFGAARDDDARPLPFALVTISDPSTGNAPVVTYADEHGDWFALLHQARHLESLEDGTTTDQLPRHVQISALRRRPNFNEPLASFPVHFDRLSPDEVDTLYQLQEDRRVLVTLGRNNRYEELDN